MAEKKTSDAMLRAVAKYDAENTKRYLIKLNKKTDADIIERLETEKSKQGFIKDCIREHIKKEAP